MSIMVLLFLVSVCCDKSILYTHFNTQPYVRINTHTAMYTQEQFLAGVLAPATVAVVLLTLIIILIFCLCKKKNAKQEYEMLQGENNGNA